MLVFQKHVVATFQRWGTKYAEECPIPPLKSAYAAGPLIYIANYLVL